MRKVTSNPSHGKLLQPQVKNQLTTDTLNAGTVRSAVNAPPRARQEAFLRGVTEEDWKNLTTQ